MIKIIGNSLNATNKKVLEKMNKMDFDYIQREAFTQLSNGATFIAINATSLLENELSFLTKVIPLIENMDGKVYVQSKNIDIIIEAIKISTKEMIIGDIAFDKAIINKIVKYLKERELKIVARIADEKEDTIYPEKSLLIAQLYVDYLLDAGIARDRILLDPVVKPLEDNYTNGKNFLNTLELFKLDFPQVKTIAKLTNLSDGMPNRKTINAHFISLAIENGLDYFVINAENDLAKAAITSTMSIIGKDRNCKNYISYCREKKNLKENNLKNEHDQI